MVPSLQLHVDAVLVDIQDVKQFNICDVILILWECFCEALLSTKHTRTWTHILVSLQKSMHTLKSDTFHLKLLKILQLGAQIASPCRGLHLCWGSVATPGELR